MKDRFPDTTVFRGDLLARPKSGPVFSTTEVVCVPRPPARRPLLLQQAAIADSRARLSQVRALRIQEGRCANHDGQGDGDHPLKPTAILVGQPTGALCPGST